MNIIQGSNSPIEIEFDQDVSGLSTLVVSLWSPLNVTRPAISWEKSDMTISGANASCPITQAQTAALPVGHMILEAKGVNGDGVTVIWNRVVINVAPRYDRNLGE